AGCASTKPRTKSRRASRRSSFAVLRLSAASVAASSQRRRVGRKTIAGNKLYEPSAASKVAGGISGIRSLIDYFGRRRLDAALFERFDALKRGSKAPSSRRTPRR